VGPFQTLQLQIISKALPCPHVRHTFSSHCQWRGSLMSCQVAPGTTHSRAHLLSWSVEPMINTFPWMAEWINVWSHEWTLSPQRPFVTEPLGSFRNNSESAMYYFFNEFIQQIFCVRKCTKWWGYKGERAWFCHYRLYKMEEKIIWGRCRVLYNPNKLTVMLPLCFLIS
jgi:hypothetical protein